MTYRVCIVVPVFNHGQNAAALAQRLERFGLRTFMVNDGSDSPSRAALHELGDHHDWVRILDHPENRGKGAAVMTGLRAAHAQGYTHALQIDADGQHDADDIPRFLALAEENPKAVIVGCPEFDASAPKGRLIARLNKVVDSGRNPKFFSPTERLSRSKSRSTTLPPCVSGRTETRKSTSRSARRTRKRPSWGILDSVMSIPDMILMRVSSFPWTIFGSR